MLENSKNNLSNANDIDVIKGKNNDLTKIKNKDEISKYLKDEGIEVALTLEVNPMFFIYHFYLKIVIEKMKKKMLS